jgi:hypothetical protein
MLMSKIKRGMFMGMAGLLVLFFTTMTFATPPQATATKIKTGLQPKPIALLTVALPKSGDFWQISEFEGVYWTYDPAAGKNVNIWLLKGNTPIRKIVANLNIENTVHHWLVPESVMPGNDYRVMIESVEKPAIKAYSSGFFTIRKVPTGITVMAPNGGQTWSRGTTQTIGWIYTGKPGTTVKITLERPGAPALTIVQNYAIYQQIEHMGSYAWLIPNNLPSAGDYKIKIQVTNTQYMDTSDQPFTIK